MVSTKLDIYNSNLVVNYSEPLNKLLIKIKCHFLVTCNYLGNKIFIIKETHVNLYISVKMHGAAVYYYRVAIQTGSQGKSGKVNLTTLEKVKKKKKLIETWKCQKFF